MEAVKIKFGKDEPVTLRFGRDYMGFWFYAANSTKMHHDPDMWTAGHFVLLDDKGRIAVYYAAFLREGLVKNVDFFLDSIRKWHNIPGLYNVPSLNVYKAPFVDVLEAVREHFEEEEKKREGRQ